MYVEGVTAHQMMASVASPMDREKERDVYHMCGNVCQMHVKGIITHQSIDLSCHQEMKERARMKYCHDNM